MAKNFINISRQECLQCYSELLVNSERHFKAAEQLADTEEYGIAISLRVLGSEELVKALIIYLDGSGLRIRQVNGVKKFFTDHKTRHFISSIFMIMTSIIKPMFEMIERLKELLHVPEARTNMNEFENALLSSDKEKANQISKDWGETKGKAIADRMSEQLDFWVAADEYKMKGFYVDYRDTLISPGQLTKAEYKFALDTTDFFKQECLRLINYVKNLSNNDREQLIKTINNNKPIYDTINQMIDRKPLSVSRTSVQK